MLAGQSGPFPAQKSRPGRTGSPRTIGAAYTGATRFRQSGRLPPFAASAPFETAQFARIYQCLRGFPMRGSRLAIQVGYCRLGQLFDCRTRGFPSSVARIRYRAGRH